MTNNAILQAPNMDLVLQRAIAAIVAAQQANGQWQDFEIPEVGISDAWVTAHVGLKLRSLPEKWRDAGVERALDRAADYLQANGRVGWSYSDRSPADADSTSHALLFLQAMGRIPHRATLDFLLEHQQPDGGFATFLAGPAAPRWHSWCISHPDVTAVAVRALLPHAADTSVADRIAPAQQYMTNVRGAEGCWPVFWWRLDWFTAANWVETLKAMDAAQAPGVDAPTSWETGFTSNLDAGLLLQILTDLGDRASARPVALSLAASQLNSGLWQTIPVLRVTRADVLRPWITSDSGPLYADGQGIYSGATIAASIAGFVQSKFM